jgi:hypothetical protein
MYVQYTQHLRAVEAPWVYSQMLTVVAGLVLVNTMHGLHVDLLHCRSLSEQLHRYFCAQGADLQHTNLDN